MLTVVAALALSSCTPPPADGGGVTPQPSPPTPPPAGATACPATITVQGSPGNFSYSVSSCTIKVGAEVTITANNNHPLNGSGVKTINAATTDQKLSFATAGEFNFNCTIHSSMTGKITVTQ